MQFFRENFCRPCSSSVSSPEEGMEYRMGNCIQVQHSQVTGRPEGSRGTEENKDGEAGNEPVQVPPGPGHGPSAAAPQPTEEEGGASGQEDEDRDELLFPHDLLPSTDLSSEFFSWESSLRTQVNSDEMKSEQVTEGSPLLAGLQQYMDISHQVAGLMKSPDFSASDLAPPPSTLPRDPEPDTRSPHLPDEVHLLDPGPAQVPMAVRVINTQPNSQGAVEIFSFRDYIMGAMSERDEEEEEADIGAAAPLDSSLSSGKTELNFLKEPEQTNSDTELEIKMHEMTGSFKTTQTDIMPNTSSAERLMHLQNMTLIYTTPSKHTEDIESGVSTDLLAEKKTGENVHFLNTGPEVLAQDIERQCETEGDTLAETRDMEIDRESGSKMRETMTESTMNSLKGTSRDSGFVETGKQEINPDLKNEDILPGTWTQLTDETKMEVGTFKDVLQGRDPVRLPESSKVVSQRDQVDEMCLDSWEDAEEYPYGDLQRKEHAKTWEERRQFSEGTFHAETEPQAVTEAMPQMRPGSAEEPRKGGAEMPMDFQARTGPLSPPQPEPDNDTGGEKSMRDHAGSRAKTRPKLAMKENTETELKIQMNNTCELKSQTDSLSWSRAGTVTDTGLSLSLQRIVGTDLMADKERGLSSNTDRGMVVKEQWNTAGEFDAPMEKDLETCKELNAPTNAEAGLKAQPPQEWSSYQEQLSLQGQSNICPLPLGPEAGPDNFTALVISPALSLPPYQGSEQQSSRGGADGTRNLISVAGSPLRSQDSPPGWGENDKNALETFAELAPVNRSLSGAGQDLSSGVTTRMGAHMDQCPPWGEGGMGAQSVLGEALMAAAAALPLTTPTAPEPREGEGEAEERCDSSKGTATAANSAAAAGREELISPRNSAAEASEITAVGSVTPSSILPEISHSSAPADEAGERDSAPLPGSCIEMPHSSAESEGGEGGGGASNSSPGSSAHSPVGEGGRERDSLCLEDQTDVSLPGPPRCDCQEARGRERGGTEWEERGGERTAFREAAGPGSGATGTEEQPELLAGARHAAGPPPDVSDSAPQHGRQLAGLPESDSAERTLRPPALSETHSPPPPWPTTQKRPTDPTEERKRGDLHPETDGQRKKPPKDSPQPPEAAVIKEQAVGVLIGSNYTELGRTSQDSAPEPPIQPALPSRPSAVSQLFELCSISEADGLRNSNSPEKSKEAFCVKHLWPQGELPTEREGPRGTPAKPGTNHSGVNSHSMKDSTGGQAGAMRGPETHREQGSPKRARDGTSTAVGSCASLPPLTVQESLHHPVVESSFTFPEFFSLKKPETPPMPYTVTDPQAAGQAEPRNDKAHAEVVKPLQAVAGPLASVSKPELEPVQQSSETAMVMVEQLPVGTGTEGESIQKGLEAEVVKTATCITTMPELREPDQLNHKADAVLVQPQMQPPTAAHLPDIGTKHTEENSQVEGTVGDKDKTKHDIEKDISMEHAEPDPDKLLSDEAISLNADSQMVSGIIRPVGEETKSRAFGFSVTAECEGVDLSEAKEEEGQRAKVMETEGTEEGTKTGGEDFKEQAVSAAVEQPPKIIAGNLIDREEELTISVGVPDTSQESEGFPEGFTEGFTSAASSDTAQPKDASHSKSELEKTSLTLNEDQNLGVSSCNFPETPKEQNPFLIQNRSIELQDCSADPATFTDSMANAMAPVLMHPQSGHTGTADALTSITASSHGSLLCHRELTNDWEPRMILQTGNEHERTRQEEMGFSSDIANEKSGSRGVSGLQETDVNIPITVSHGDLATNDEHRDTVSFPTQTAATEMDISLPAATVPSTDHPNIVLEKDQVGKEICSAAPTLNYVNLDKVEDGKKNRTLKGREKEQQIIGGKESTVEMHQSSVAPLTCPHTTEQGDTRVKGVENDGCLNAEVNDGNAANKAICDTGSVAQAGTEASELFIHGSANPPMDLAADAAPSPSCSEPILSESLLTIASNLATLDTKTASHQMGAEVESKCMAAQPSESSTENAALLESHNTVPASKEASEIHHAVESELTLDDEAKVLPTESEPIETGQVSPAKPLHQAKMLDSLPSNAEKINSASDLKAEPINAQPERSGMLCRRSAEHKPPITGLDFTSVGYPYVTPGNQTEEDREEDYRGKDYRQRETEVLPREMLIDETPVQMKQEETSRQEKYEDSPDPGLVSASMELSEDPLNRNVGLSGGLHLSTDQNQSVPVTEAETPSSHVGDYAWTGNSAMSQSNLGPIPKISQHPQQQEASGGGDSQERDAPSADDWQGVPSFHDEEEQFRNAATLQCAEVGTAREEIPQRAIEAPLGGAQSCPSVSDVADKFGSGAKESTTTDASDMVSAGSTQVIVSKNGPEQSPGLDFSIATGSVPKSGDQDKNDQDTLTPGCKEKETICDMKVDTVAVVPTTSQQRDAIAHDHDIAAANQIPLQCSPATSSLLDNVATSLFQDPVVPTTHFAASLACSDHLMREQQVSASFDIHSAAQTCHGPQADVEQWPTIPPLTDKPASQPTLSIFPTCDSCDPQHLVCGPTAEGEVDSPLSTAATRESVELEQPENTTTGWQSLASESSADSHLFSQANSSAESNKVVPQSIQEAYISYEQALVVTKEGQHRVARATPTVSLECGSFSDFKDQSKGSKGVRDSNEVVQDTDTDTQGQLTSGHLSEKNKGLLKEKEFGVPVGAEEHSLSASPQRSVALNKIPASREEEDLLFDGMRVEEEHDFGTVPTGTLAGDLHPSDTPTSLQAHCPPLATDSPPEPIVADCDSVHADPDAAHLTAHSSGRQSVCQDKDLDGGLGTEAERQSKDSAGGLGTEAVCQSKDSAGGLGTEAECQSKDSGVTSEDTGWLIRSLREAATLSQTEQTRSRTEEVSHNSPIQHLTSPQASVEFCEADEETAPPEGTKEDQPDLRCSLIGQTEARGSTPNLPESFEKQALQPHLPIYLLEESADFPTPPPTPPERCTPALPHSELPAPRTPPPATPVPDLPTPAPVRVECPTVCPQDFGLRSSDSDGAFETPESTTPVKAATPPLPQAEPDAPTQQPSSQDTGFCSDSTQVSESVSLSEPLSEPPVFQPPCRSNSVVFDEDKPIASSGAYNLDLLASDPFPDSAFAPGLAKDDGAGRRRSTDCVPQARCPLTRSLSLQAGELENPEEGSDTGVPGTLAQPRAEAFNVGTESAPGTLRKNKKSRSASFKKKPLSRQSSNTASSTEGAAVSSTPEAKKKAKTRPESPLLPKEEQEEEGTSAITSPGGTLRKNKLIAESPVPKAEESEPNKLAPTSPVHPPTSTFPPVPDEDSPILTKASYNWDPDNFEGIDPFHSGGSKIANSPVLSRKGVSFTSAVDPPLVPEDPVPLPLPSPPVPTLTTIASLTTSIPDDEQPLNKRQSVRLEFDYSEESGESPRDSTPPPKKLGKKPGAKMPLRKPKLGTRKPPPPEEPLDNTPAQPLANNEDMPIPKTTYNFDPSKWDDPNFNPFSSSTAIPSSPQLSHTSYNFDPDTFDDSINPFRCSSKIGNSPPKTSPASFEVPANDNDNDSIRELEDPNQNKPAKKKKAPLKSNTFRVKKSPKRSSLSETSSQDEHATDEEKLASSSNQKWAALQGVEAELNSDPRDFPQPSDLTDFESSLSSQTHDYEIEYMEKIGSSTPATSGKKPSLYLKLDSVTDSPTKGSRSRNSEPSSPCTGSFEEMEAQIAGGAKSPVLHPPRGAPESEKSRKRESDSLIRCPGGERDGVTLPQDPEDPTNALLLDRLVESGGPLHYLEPDLAETNPTAFAQKLQEELVLAALRIEALQVAHKISQTTLPTVTPEHQREALSQVESAVTKSTLYSHTGYSEEDGNPYMPRELDHSLGIAREEIVAKEKEAAEWQRKYEESRQEVVEMRRIVTEYEKTIAQMIEDGQRDKSLSHHTIQQLIVEKDQALADLNSVEKSLADLFRRYEKMKDVLEGFRKNEEVLKKCAQEYLSRVRKEEQRYQALKIHAEEKLDKANADIAQVRAKAKQEQAAYQASLRKEQMKVESLERTLEQKNKEIEELTKICDELISKMGKS
ncbi:uncharacterized protein tacc2 isoform X3 [Brienomyrus brachyistius]|uniref:uncharacterized protein tacc2 isoform X3 n=1 Tax=Brienomyrus brachyistius TaxID=42636 RepID=UPI0020B2B747|nr:uncharacterized protein tacc2 isoform X3 [Brienomyrus brachyistius]